MYIISVNFNGPSKKLLSVFVKKKKKTTKEQSVRFTIITIFLNEMNTTHVNELPAFGMEPTRKKK